MGVHQLGVLTNTSMNMLIYSGETTNYRATHGYTMYCTAMNLDIEAFPTGVAGRGDGRRC